MTRLRKLMLDELERRNYSQTTRRAYLLGVEQFSKYFHRSPEQLGLNEVRDYQAQLFRVRNLTPATVAVRLAALRFLFVAVLKRHWTVDDTPYPKRPAKLPTVLTQEEVGRMIDAALTALHRALLMLLYATGLRRAEAAHLKISDIDSKRMVIHVVGGKGRKDRDVMLSPTLAHELEPLALANKKIIYNLLFRLSAETLMEFARDPQYLGAVGFFSVLHTWSQKLLHHPHVHCVVPEGGVSADGSRWVRPRYNFFLPVKAMAKAFRGKFREALREAFTAGDLRFPDS